MYHGVTPDRDPPDLPTDDPAKAAAPSQAETDASDSARKERVLHTRIPAVLEHELKRLAGNLRVPVSNLVRTILEDALAVADRATGVVEAELHAAARIASTQRETLKKRFHPRSILDEVIGFQSLVLTQDTLCTACGKDLRRGAEAWLGIRDTPGPRVIACADCLPKPAK